MATLPPFPPRTGRLLVDGKALTGDQLRRESREHAAVRVAGEMQRAEEPVGIRAGGEGWRFKQLMHRRRVIARRLAAARASTPVKRLGWAVTGGELVLYGALGVGTVVGAYYIGKWWKSRRLAAAQRAKPRDGLDLLGAVG